MKEELTFAHVCCGSGILLCAFNLKALLPNHHPQCGDEKTWDSCRMPGQNALPRFPSQPEPGPWGTCQQLEASSTLCHSAGCQQKEPPGTRADPSSTSPRQATKGSLQLPGPRSPGLEQSPHPAQAARFLPSRTHTHQQSMTQPFSAGSRERHHSASLCPVYKTSRSSPKSGAREPAPR